MKIKLVVIDLEVPTRVKKWGLRLGIPVATLLVGGGIAWAAGLHTWAQGDPLTAADLNGNFSNLQQQITTSTFGTRTPSAAHAGISAAVASSVSEPLVFNVKKFDLGNELDTTTGKITVTNAGIYLVDCQLEFKGPTAGIDYAAEIYKNATGVVGSNSSSSAIPANAYFTTQSTATIQLAAGDVLACQLYTSDNSTPTIYPGNDFDQTHFAVTRVY